MTYHEPVMREEVLLYLHPKKGKSFVDATLGDGGHAISFLQRGAWVIGLDINQASLERAKKRIENMGMSENFVGILGNFKNVDALTSKYGPFDGVLYDLGYSSTQLEEDELGLSFQRDSLLDMRLDKNLGVTASDLLNALPEKDLASLIADLSGERYARRFARAIVEFRKLKKFAKTSELSDLLQKVAPSGYENGRIHPATRTFQALRMVVNDEIENLKTSLPRAARILVPGGRLVVISFQSIEDRIVKTVLKPAQPTLEMLTDKPILPSSAEVKRNPRARSAIMRVYENRKH